MCSSGQQPHHHHWGREHSGLRVGDEEGATGQREALHAAQTGAHDALYMQCCVCGHVHTLHTCIQASTGVCIIGGSWSVNHSPPVLYILNVECHSG